MLAGAIGSRPVGTPGNARARDYIIAQLSGSGFDVSVHDTDARRPEVGQTARVRNIVAVRAGARPEGLALVTHYDSSAAAPGAADAGLGVAACLEAARVLAGRPDPAYSLFVIVTDAEEVGLMGAAALIEDRQLTGRIRAYLNFEAIGSAGPVLLFEIGPGGGALVSAWARSAPRPRGTSVATEIYRRLPNDTDFTILKRTGAPGLNFAAFGDSYAYHTARDRPERLRPETIRHAGETAVSMVLALDRLDLARRTPDGVTYFDVAGVVAVAYGSRGRRAIAGAALVLGAIAALRFLFAMWHQARLRLLATAFWTIVLVVAAGAAGVGATWLVRWSREALHPWYGHPERLFTFIMAAILIAAWLVFRLIAAIPVRFRGPGHPAAIWGVTLPVWIGLALATGTHLPEASYLWTIPLLAAGVVFVAIPADRPALLRPAAAGVLAVAGTLWIPPARDFLLFMVPMFGRLTMVTPVFVFTAVVLAAGVMVGPAIAGMCAGVRVPFGSLTSGIAAVLVLAVSGALTYVAPPYTEDRPLRAVIQYVQDDRVGRAVWDAGANEPRLDLDAGGSPLQWRAGRERPPPDLPIRALAHPAVFRAASAPLAGPPGTVAAAVTHAADRLELEVHVTPAEPGIVAALVLPPGIAPADANFPGITRPRGAWNATYIAPPPEGVTFRLSFANADHDALRRASVILATRRLPGGVGWQGLPPWLPQDRVVWMASAIHILPLPLPRE
jgi:hypothetical protein